MQPRFPILKFYGFRTGTGSPRRHGGLGLLLFAFLLAGSPAKGEETNLPPALSLLPQAQVDSQGVFLHQIVPSAVAPLMPRVSIHGAPAFGHALVLTRSQVQATLQSALPDYAKLVWSGPDRIQITRRSRQLSESEVKEQLQAFLQSKIVQNRGELELRLTRPWNPVLIPDESIALNVLDLPASGVSSSFILRFEIKCGRETIGTWQAVCQGRIWQEIWVAGSPLKRGQPLSGADIQRERRDILGARDVLLDLPADPAMFEIAESVPAGVALTARSIRPRPVVRRGDWVEALLQDGAMTISLKVEILEEGAIGQAVRVRNPITRREFRGKVQNEQMVLVLL